ncbi:MAG: DUF4349 domain-containing protein [Oscillospiraceae bacterium]|nr:DUF4349 domain-containing protein [Oscillospiraceae bacterium]
MNYKKINVKKISALLALTFAMAFAATALTGCGSADMVNPESSYERRNMSGSDTGDMAPGGAVLASKADISGDFSDAYLYAAPDAGSYGAGFGDVIAPVTEGLSEKIIYSYYAQIETLKFDETITNVGNLITAHGAFVESSNIRGNNYETTYYGGASYRSAYFAIRVPVDQLNAITSRLETLGNIVYQNSNAENITSQFIDTETRLKTLLVQEERLLDMLSKAEDIPDLIAIEERISDVRYQIERLTATLNNWQRQVDYSTLTINIQEVEEYTEPPKPVDRTYWEQMADGIRDTLNSIGRFFMNLLMWIVVSAPTLLILALIAIVLFVAVRGKLRKRKAARAQKASASPQESADTQPQQDAAQFSPENM